MLLVTLGCIDGWGIPTGAPGWEFHRGPQGIAGRGPEAGERLKVLLVGDIPTGAPQVDRRGGPPAT